MKKLLLGITFLASIAAHASEDARTFKDPHINGLSFSSDSNPSVVCNYLGYESAVSTYLKSRLTDAVIVTREGVVGSDYATVNDFVSVFTKVTCKEPLKKEINLQIPTLVKNPSHPSLKRNVSRQSSESGVCKMLGYERAAGGTLGKVIYPMGGLPIIDSKGTLVSEDFSSGSIIKKIICL